MAAGSSKGKIRRIGFRITPMNHETSGVEVRSLPQTGETHENSHGFTLSRVAVFSSVILAILLLATTLVCLTWSYLWEGAVFRKWQIVPFSLTLLFIPMSILGWHRSDIWVRFLYRISSIWLGVLSFCVAASIASWIVFGLAKWLGLGVESPVVAGAFFGFACAVSIYAILNAGRVRITRVDVELPNLPDGWRSRRAALITDLHLGNLNGAEFASHIVARLQRLGPDVVFISGDLFDGTRARLDRLAAPLTRLRAPLGVYFVTGNHEEFVDRAEYTRVVEGLGIRVLHNEKITVEDLQIVGVHDGEAGDPELFHQVLKRVELDLGRPSILLVHRPANLSIAAEAGISLQLSGHTHGGQFWPWTLIVSRLYGRFAYGLNRLGNLMVYTTSGAGTWGPPMRTGTKSEIVLLRFVSSGI